MVDVVTNGSEPLLHYLLYTYIGAVLFKVVIVNLRIKPSADFTVLQSREGNNKLAYLFRQKNKRLLREA